MNFCSRNDRFSFSLRIYSVAVHVIRLTDGDDDQFNLNFIAPTKRLNGSFAPRGDDAIHSVSADCRDQPSDASDGGLHDLRHLLASTLTHLCSYLRMRKGVIGAHVQITRCVVSALSYVWEMQYLTLGCVISVRIVD